MLADGPYDDKPLNWLDRWRKDLYDGKRVTVVTYGDSWTYGSVAEGWEESCAAGLDASLVHGSWASQLGRSLQQMDANLQFYNEGMPGWTSVKGHGAYATAVGKYKPDVLVLNFGINDWKKHVPPSDYASAMEGMIQSAIDARTSVLLWVSGPLSTKSGQTYGWSLPIDDSEFPHSYDVYTDILFRLAERYELTIVDAAKEIDKLWEAGTDLSGWFYDAIHFKQKGHDVIYRCLSEVLITAPDTDS